MITQRPQRMNPDELPNDWHPLVRNIYASRLERGDEVEKHLRRLLSPDSLVGLDVAVQRIAQALAQKESILVYGDYDVDGATATALTVRVLRQLGGHVSWFIPHRSTHGYGFNLAGLAALPITPNLLITVDNGMQSHEAVIAAQARGIDVIITDHHTPSDTLPPAIAVINPNRHDCLFAGKKLAGVGVAFYLLLGLRNHLLAQGRWPDSVRLSDYLELVALGTVADLVPLDYNNRILVNHGLACMRNAHGNTGIRALLAIANIEPRYLSAQDIAFSLAPRLNAMGRLGEMSDGVALLLAEDWQTAQEYAQQCDAYNRDRKALENEAVQEAMLQVSPELPLVAAYEPTWHEGIIGIIAARLKNRFSRPALAATNSNETGWIKASLRSVRDVSLPELLNEAARDLPGDALHYGGHAAAAGLSVRQEHYAALITAMNRVLVDTYGHQIPQEPIYIDGELPANLFNLEWARYLERLEPWGTALPVPVFANPFEVLECRLLGSAHSRLVLRDLHSGNVYNASWFFHSADYRTGTRLRIAYQLQINRFYGDERLSLLVQHAQPL
ncbi:MAG: single-stranded-DNA-specific exonuclease RecJ [Cardiobacteriaceae bacterium]|nr:single-stranded-DNA-specific exonuclease RecJ [Cardiobacteriaceae bacterium]